MISERGLVSERRPRRSSPSSTSRYIIIRWSLLISSSSSGLLLAPIIFFCEDEAAVPLKRVVKAIFSFFSAAGGETLFLRRLADFGLKTRGRRDLEMAAVVAATPVAALISASLIIIAVGLPFLCLDGIGVEGALGLMLFLLAQPEEEEEEDCCCETLPLFAAAGRAGGGREVTEPRRPPLLSGPSTSSALARAPPDDASTAISSTTDSRRLKRPLAAVLKNRRPTSPALWCGGVPLTGVAGCSVEEANDIIDWESLVVVIERRLPTPGGAGDKSASMMGGEIRSILSSPTVTRSSVAGTLAAARTFIGIMHSMSSPSPSPLILISPATSVTSWSNR
jgi:hypothetical protein